MNEDEILSPEEWDGALLDAITSESGAMAWDRELKLRAHDLALRALCEAERQARLDAERTLDETVTKLVRERTRATDAERERDFWLRKANDTVARAEAERDALAAALRKAREFVWLVEHVAEDWAPEAEEAVRADLAAIDAALALLPSPASQEAVSDE